MFKVIFLFISFQLILGCSFRGNGDIRPPLMNDSDFSQFEKPEIGEENSSTNVYIITGE